MAEPLSPHFDASEFRCPCGCGICNVSAHLIQQLERLRNDYGKPLVINSGCRCPAHNAAVGGVKDSAHVATDTEPCEAADIRVSHSGEVFDLLDRILFQRLFRRIGVGQSLIHVDVDATKPNPALWVYDNK